MFKWFISSQTCLPEDESEHRQKLDPRRGLKPADAGIAESILFNRAKTCPFC